MRKIRKLLGVTFLLVALLVLQLPSPEAAAAGTVSEFSVSESGVLTKYNGNKANVTIPDTVTTIGTDAFQYNTTIKTVDIPDSVTSIEPYAFWGCSSLQSISFGKGLKGIDDYAFANCKGLTSLVLPENITYIGIYAFQDDLNLADITIPYTTMRIHESAFDGCYKLVIHADPGSYAAFYATDFAERQAEMAEYEDIPEYTDPVTVTEPEEEDETETGAVVVEDPGNTLSSVRIVGNQAVFFMNGSAGSVYDGSQMMGSSGEGENAEGDQEASSDQYLYTSSIPKYTIVEGEVVADQAFYKSELTSLSLPSTIREIGQFSYARSALTEASVPEGVETISYGAFYHCDDLQTVNLPSTVINVEPKAFEHTALTDGFLNNSRYVPSVISSENDFLICGDVLLAYRGIAPSFDVPYGVRLIAAGAFAGHEEIEAVNLPDTCQIICEGAFEGCSSLALVNVGEELSIVRDRAFAGTALTSVMLPKTYSREGLQAWPAGCDLLKAKDNEIPVSYETSAQRLSNASYRGNPTGAAGVTVIGLEGAEATLEGADTAYTLTIEPLEDLSSLEEAKIRVLSYLDDFALSGLHVDYDLTLTDSTGIPITKLGKQALTVMLPLSEQMSGAHLVVFTLDRNGQLEEIPSEQVDVGGENFLRMTTYHLSPFSIYATSQATEEVVLTASNMLVAMSGPAGSGIVEYPLATEEGWGIPLRIKWVLAGALTITGLIFLMIQKK